MSVSSTSGSSWRTYSLAECVEIASQSEPFLVQDLVCSTVTLLYGEPLAGKSSLGLTLAISLVTGDPFLGRPPAREIGRVVVLTTEVDGVQECGRRASEVLGARVHDVWWDVVPIHALDADGWERLAEELGPDRATFVILDNLTGVVQGSLNDDASVRTVFDGLRRLTARGAIVLVLAHISEKSSERGKSTKPLGSTAISAAARWRVRIDRQGDDRLRLTCDGNAAQRVVLTLARGAIATEFHEISKETAQDRQVTQRQRHDATKTRNAQIAQRIATEWRELSARTISELISAAGYGIKANTALTHLSKKQQYGALVERTTSGWQLRAAEGHPS